MSRKILSLLILTLAVTGLAFGQQPPNAQFTGGTVAFTTGDAVFVDDEGFDSVLENGSPLNTSGTISVPAGGFLEIILTTEAGASISMRLSGPTEMAFSLGPIDNPNANLSVSGGRARAVARGLSASGQQVRVRTGNTVGGVRGTDFSLGGEGEGEIFTLPEEDGSSSLFVETPEGELEVPPGFGFAPGEGVVGWGADRISNALGGLLSFNSAELQGLSRDLNNLLEQVQQVQQQAQQAIQDANQAAQAQTEPEPEPEPVVDAEPEFEDQTPEWVLNTLDALGFELGSVTIDGVTYGKVVGQPTFALGRWNFGLYLPVIYQSNIFDPSDWYRPAGNDEWSFGTDQEDTQAAVLDAIADTALKFRFIEFNDRDAFLRGADDASLFFKLGNLNNLSLGYGIVMQDFANDTDFPAVRRVGINVGLQGERFGFEALTNSFGDPEVLGLRLFLGRGFSIGAGAAVDLFPASALPSTEAAFADYIAADPIFVNPAADISLSILRNAEALNATLFGQAATLVPVLRNAFGDVPAGPFVGAGGLSGDFTDVIANYGVSAGVLGNIGPIDYRLEYRDFVGEFIPSFYGPGYERLRGDRVIDTLDYAQASVNGTLGTDPIRTTGVYGEAGGTFFDLVTLTGGYFWPWEILEDGTVQITEDDLIDLSLTVTVPRGTFDFLSNGDLTGSLSYIRTGFAPTIIGAPLFPDYDRGLEGVSLIDANTTLAGEIIYPVAPIMNIAVVVTTTVLRNADGSLQYDPITGNPRYAPSITVETRISGGGGAPASEE